MRLPAPPLPVALAVLGLALTPGCFRVDPARQAATEYVDEVTPLLDENGFVAEQLLEVAAGVYNGKATGADAKKDWAERIVPLAEHLRDQAILVTPPSDWALDHKALVDVWTVRSDAYRDLGDAADQGDRELWKKARQRADDAKKNEETWFRHANERLAPLNLSFDQFP